MRHEDIWTRHPGGCRGSNRPEPSDTGSALPSVAFAGMTSSAILVQPVLNRIRKQIQPVAHTEFLVDKRQVIAQGVFADVQ